MAALQSHQHNQHASMMTQSLKFTPFCVRFWWINFRSFDGRIQPFLYARCMMMKGMDRMMVRVLNFMSSSTTRLILLIVYLFCDRWMLLVSVERQARENWGRGNSRKCRVKPINWILTKWTQKSIDIIARCFRWKLLGRPSGVYFFFFIISSDRFFPVDDER